MLFPAPNLWLALLISAGVCGSSLALGEPISTRLDVSAHSAANEAIRRAETRLGEFGPPRTYPADVDTAARFLEKAGAGRYDRWTLDGWETGKRRERLQWSDSERGNFLAVRPELILGGHLSEVEDGSSLLGGGGLVAHGIVLGTLSFYTRGMVNTEKTEVDQFSHQFSPEYGETYSVEKVAGDSLLPDRTYNRHEYYLKYQGRFLSVKAGRDWIHGGPGYFSSLIASRETPPYYMAELRLDFAPWLQVRNALLRFTDTDHSILKYGQYQRFGLRPFRSLEIGLGQMVIYQDRDPDLRYALPLVPLTFTEQNNGGLDNASISLDFHWLVRRGISAWSEVFLDDLIGPTSFFDDFWENRWALLAGFQVTSIWEGLDADLVVEWSRVEPWTYIGRSPQSGFKHFNVPSASRLGPDSRSLDMRLAWRPLTSVELTALLSEGAKGKGDQATLGTVHVDSVHGTTKRFLADAEESVRYEIGLDFRAMSMLWARASFEHRVEPDPSLGLNIMMRWLW